MNKINLDIKPVFKTINVNGKSVKIPKLGLKHHAILNESSSLEDGTKKLIQSIDKSLSVAERDLVSLHLLEFNGKLKTEIELDGEVYSVYDVILNQQLRFYIGDTEFRFRTPKQEDFKSTIDGTLNACCVSVKENGVSKDIPDFIKMPAYTYKWLEKICNSITLKTKTKDISGLYNLMELFDGTARKQ